MLRRLDIPFRDAAASDLAWSLLPGAVAPEALAHLRASGTGTATLDLHVLGASHAVEVAVGGVVLTEVVAYGAPEGRTLQQAPTELVRDGLSYRFASTVEHHAPEAMEGIARTLQDRLEGQPDALFATFPGAPGAVTALRATSVADGAGWETWHLYPERGEVVRTSTSVAPVGAPSVPASAPLPLAGAVS
ncbi:DUF2617 family protein [Patulibacter americanus]|uniref:DUF2617 family protein n=1 Tax=Patulibacter americanus TaxID=588672 RepID=UPI0003B78958|nr:DUF2617 family protein [Patulibacter americanus]